MKNKITFPLILLFIALGSLPLQGQGFILKKDIYVAEDEVLDNVVSLGGEILIKGKIKDSVVAFGGTIIVEGEVGEVVLGFGAEITLRSSAIIKGDVVSLGGTIDREPGASVEGDTVSFAFETPEDLKKFFTGGLFGSLFPLFLIIKLITLFIWFILAIILAAIFPHQDSLFGQIGELRRHAQNIASGRVGVEPKQKVWRRQMEEVQCVRLKNLAVVH